MMRNAARVAVAAALCVTAAYALAEPGRHLGTKEEQTACKPDVYRLCSEFIPVADRIITCLKQNRSKLSPACRKVFSAE